MATKIYLPNLLEFIYHAITEKGFKYLFNRLEREDFLKVKNESKARAFSEFGNLEDKILMLSKLGYSVNLVIYDKEKQKKVKIEDILIAYMETPENDLTKTIVRDKLFACRDIDFIKSLQTMSQSSMSKVYSVNRKFLEVREHSEKFNTRTLVNKLQAEANLDWYSKTIQFALDIEPVLETFKIDMLKLRTLLYLQTSPNGSTKENISRKLNRVNVTGMINELYECNMLQFNLNNKNIVQIDVYGIMVLEQIISKFP